MSSGGGRFEHEEHKKSNISRFRTCVIVGGQVLDRFNRSFQAIVSSDWHLAVTVWLPILAL